MTVTFYSSGLGWQDFNFEINIQPVIIYFLCNICYCLNIRMLKSITFKILYATLLYRQLSDSCDTCTHILRKLSLSRIVLYLKWLCISLNSDDITQFLLTTTLCSMLCSNFLSNSILKLKEQIQYIWLFLTVQEDILLNVHMPTIMLYWNPSDSTAMQKGIEWQLILSEI